MAWLKSNSKDSKGMPELEWTQEAPMTVVSAYEDIIKFYQERTGSSGTDIETVRKMLKRVASRYQSENDRTEAVEAMEGFVNLKIQDEFSN